MNERFIEFISAVKIESQPKGVSPAAAHVFFVSFGADNKTIKWDSKKV